eukprot:6594224-Prymnesium_polylepis.1
MATGDLASSLSRYRRTEMIVFAKFVIDALPDEHDALAVHAVVDVDPLRILHSRRLPRHPGRAARHHVLPRHARATRGRRVGLVNEADATNESKSALAAIGGGCEAAAAD